LKIRGYDIAGHVIFKEGRYGNSEYLAEYFSDRNVQTLSLTTPPARHEDSKTDEDFMGEYYNSNSSSSHAEDFMSQMLSDQNERIAHLQDMPRQAKESIWYPFTQHQFLEEKNITVIDSAYGDNFDTLRKNTSDTDPVLQPSFDGSASWWTQGLGHGNPDLALAAASAAGRYTHVILASTVHEPALKLAQLLLQMHQNPRLSKVFYSDNGSTGMEVAIKMALRASCVRYNWDHKNDNIDILGFKGSYHGDTMGVMDSSEPSTYNDRVEWYRPKGGTCSTSYA
jgi:bifunctional dethiobiotin synthetase / adenosylmethionine---8-amino-7-oxononanoate aminotransferase